jgi:hypothetical protein
MNVRSMKNTRFSGLEMLKGLAGMARIGCKPLNRIACTLLAPSGQIVYFA